MIASCIAATLLYKLHCTFHVAVQLFYIVAVCTLVTVVMNRKPAACSLCLCNDVPFRTQAAFQPGGLLLAMPVSIAPRTVACTPA